MDWSFYQSAGYEFTPHITETGSTYIQLKSYDIIADYYIIRNQPALVYSGLNKEINNSCCGEDQCWALTGSIIRERTQDVGGKVGGIHQGIV